MPFGELWKRFSKAKTLELTLDTVLNALETTENVLNTTPIPGAAAVIAIILDVMKRQERASGNAKSVVEQQERWEKLVGQLKECESDPETKPPGTLSKLRDASQALASQLEVYRDELKKATTHEIRPRWMTCTRDEKALQEFLSKSNEAIDDYHHAQGNRIEECIMDLGYRLTLSEWDRVIETLPRAKLAGYDANRTVGTLSSCSEGTRKPLLEDVAKWIKDPAADKIFWLKERAGFGKTAIALTVAEQAAKAGTLAASFFFSYQIPDLSNTSRFLPTIIYQLCLFGGTPYKQRFAGAVAKHTGLLDAKLKHQGRKLFLDPLESLNIPSTNISIVIVIDALDECQREDAEDLTAFIASLSSLDLPLKLFITSRPEQQITAPFSDLGVQPRVILDTSNEDVEIYLRAELAKITSKPGIRDLNLPKDWIKEEEIQGLLERAGARGVSSDSTSAEKGLFVYIATVVLFLGDTDACDPQNHLQILLSITIPPRYRPYDALDTLYTRVLHLAVRDRDDLLERFRAVVGGMKTMEVGDVGIPPIATLERLLDLPQGEVRRALVNLQSVIKYPDTDSALPSFHHRSFSDFLTNKDRSGPLYYIDLKLHQKRLALGCIRAIVTSPLKEDIVKAMNVEDYFYYPEAQLSPEIIHATRHLRDYYQSSGCDKDILEELEKFLKDDFGWWIEVIPHLPTTNTGLRWIPDTIDPKDELELPVLFRALASSPAFLDVDKMIHATALLRKELRRYILAVTKQQDGERGEPQAGAQAMIMSIKNCIYQLEERLERAGRGLQGDRKKACVAILMFAKDAEAVVDGYQLSAGNREEVESSRNCTIFLRRQVKPLLVKEGWFTEEEPFEQQGIWAVSVDSGERMDLDSDCDS